MKSQELFDRGYAIKVYDIRPENEVWYYRGNTYRADGIPCEHYESFCIAKIEDVLSERPA